MKSTAQLDRDPQAQLPTGLTLVASRSKARGDRTPQQTASARAFLAAAGRVTFDKGQATLKAVWMAVAYRASLGDGPERVCTAALATLADDALVSVRTVRYGLVALAALGWIHTDNRKGGRRPSTWVITELLPSVVGGKDCRAGRQGLPGRAAKVAAEVRDVRKREKCTSSSRARVICEACGHSWPDKAEYGTTCYRCGHDPSTGTPADDKPPNEPKACTCGDAYSNSYGRQCVDCEGEPSPAQRAAVQAAQDAASTPPLAETEDEPPPKSDPDALLRWWEKERANFNRKYHMGETNGGHTDDRTEASGEHGSAGHGRGTDGVDHTRGQRAPGRDQEVTRAGHRATEAQQHDGARARP